MAMRYPGGKGGAGVYQTIINMMPPHHTYIETHFGGGNIFERKKPAPASIVIDIDDLITSQIAMRYQQPGLTVINGDASRFLRDLLRTHLSLDGYLVYSDPPYMMETRKGGKIYRYEYTDEQHLELLSLLKAVSAAGGIVILSGYRSSLYDAMLQEWNSLDFQAMTRRGLATETIWFNFERCEQLHDTRYIGANFRERERIKRQQKRWRARLEKMPALERQAMLEILTELAVRDLTATKSDEISPTFLTMIPGETTHEKTEH